MTGQGTGRGSAQKRGAPDGGLDSLCVDACFEEEPCFDCRGAGCGTCANTGLLYTEAAIKLQLAERDRDN